LTVGFGIAAAASMLSGAYQLMLVCIGIIILCILVYELDANPLWRYLELVFAALPLTVAILASDFAGDATTYLSVATVLLLVVAVGASVRHRLVAARIVSSIGWIILPIGLIADEVGGIMRSSENVLALYIAVLFALSVSRAVALGRFMAPKSAPVSSLTLQSSMSYLLGMIAASVIVAIASFTSGNAIVGIASLLAATSYLLFHFWYFEKSNYFAALLPITLQIILIRMVEPYTSSSDNTIVIFSLVSSLLALAACAYTAKSSDQNSNGPIEKIDIQKIALASLYFAPLSIVFAGEVLWTMPLTALIATVVTLIYFRNQEQSTVEALGGLVLSAVFWIFYFAGLRDVQFYTHMIAGLFALYAYFRHVTRDEANTHNYIIAALSTSTVPLALEALGSSERGEILGLWLLLEQVGFLVLGVTIKQPLLTKWGLYVGVAAVIYQLRDLGWAMLAVLSLFIIGVATYRALRQPNDENKE